MSNKATMLAYFEYFLSCSQFCLTKTKEAKVANDNLAMSFIKVTSIKNVSVGGISIKIAFAKSTYINARLSGINS